MALDWPDLELDTEWGRPDPAPTVEAVREESSSGPTWFEKRLSERLEDPEFAAAYLETMAEIELETTDEEVERRLRALTESRIAEKKSREFPK